MTISYSQAQEYTTARLLQLLADEVHESSMTQYEKGNANTLIAALIDKTANMPRPTSICGECDTPVDGEPHERTDSEVFTAKFQCQCGEQWLEHYIYGSSTELDYNLRI